MLGWQGALWRRIKSLESGDQILSCGLATISVRMPFAARNRIGKVTHNLRDVLSLRAGGQEFT